MEKNSEEASGAKRFKGSGILVGIFEK